MTEAELRTSFVAEIKRQARLAANWWANAIAAENEMPELAGTVERLIFDELTGDWLARRAERPGDWEEDVAPIILTSQRVHGITGGWGFYLTDVFDKARAGGQLSTTLNPPQGRVEMVVRYERVEVRHNDDHSILFDINKQNPT